MTPSIRRRVELELPADELWALIGTAEGWREWLVDDADLEVAGGRSGRVTLDGAIHSVSIREVVEGERIVFEWTSGPDDETSTVTIDLDHGAERTTLEITETRARVADADADVQPSMAWDVRIALLWIRATLGVPAFA